jgi:hypothetical protein
MSFTTVAFAAKPYSQHFSASFKAAIDQAMAQTTGQGRTKLLIQALHNGTDDEVFYVLPLLVPAKVFRGAQAAHVCIPEVKASLENGEKFVATPAAEQHSFPSLHAKKIRSDTNNLIRCLDRYYHDGWLHLPPPAPSSNYSLNRTLTPRSGARAG